MTVLWLRSAQDGRVVDVREGRETALVLGRPIEVQVSVHSAYDLSLPEMGSLDSFDVSFSFETYFLDA